MAKPLLYLDIDGVIVLHEKPQRVACRQVVVAGTPNAVPIGIEDLLLPLHDAFEVLWLTGWRSRAPLLGAKLHLPAWEPLEWGDHKLPALREHSAGRPWAWVDNETDFELRRHGRSANDGLILDINDYTGITTRDVATLIRFAHDHSAS